MEKFCPLCNGIHTIFILCDSCGAEMTDQGTVSDYYGPYSPYDAHDVVEDDCCIHLFYCKYCHLDHRLAVPLERLSDAHFVE